MSVTGLDEVTNRLRSHWQQAAGPKTEQALTELLIAGDARVTAITPVDTGTLVNSKEQQIRRLSTGWQGVLYFGAKYAPAVHFASGKLKGQPRADFGVTRAGEAFGGGTGVGNYWDPNGEPRFLEKGMEEAGELDAPEILKRVYGV